MIERGTGTGREIEIEIGLGIGRIEGIEGIEGIEIGIETEIIRAERAGTGNGVAGEQRGVGPHRGVVALLGDVTSEVYLRGGEGVAGRDVVSCIVLQIIR